MNIGFISCSLLGGLFLLLWLLFTLLGDRAAMLISGFNTLPPESARSTTFRACAATSAAPSCSGRRCSPPARRSRASSRSTVP